MPTIKADDEFRRKLRAFDAEARAYGAALGDTERLGRLRAAEDIATLHALGRTLAGSVLEWAVVIAAAPIAGAGEFNRDRAARLILESVFDELLDAPAWRLLAAAVDLAEM